MASWPAALVDIHRRNNRDTLRAWERFATHRRRVTALIEESAAQAGGPGGAALSLALLGAGNCNDVDLGVLAPRFETIHLVDVDREALEAARSRAAAEVMAKLVLRAPVDLSGALGRLAAWRSKPATAAQLGGLPASSAENVLKALEGSSFDVVASTCFVSQLMRTCYVALGARHPQLHLIAAALALGHVRALVRLIAPGGVGLLVTDMTSSETYPLEEAVAELGGRAVLANLCATDNVFAGTSATLVEGIMREDEAVAPLVEDVKLLDPWLWDFSAERTYLCYALRFRRHG